MNRMALAILLIVLAILSIDSAYAANEKGPRCSDGIDNDGDGLIDGNDPDCGGNATDTFSTLVFKDANGVVIGPAENGSTASGYSYVYFTGVGRPARIRISRNLLFASTTGVLYWDLPGCNGNSFLPATESAFFEDIKLMRLPNTNEEVLMVSDPSQWPVITVASFSDDAGNCTEDVRQMQVSPWVKITLDFVPPFSLELQ